MRPPIMTKNVIKASKASVKFLFFCRLTLPGNIVEDGRETAEYKAETGEDKFMFTVCTKYSEPLVENHVNWNISTIVFFF